MMRSLSVCACGHDSHDHYPKEGGDPEVRECWIGPCPCQRFTRATTKKCAPRSTKPVRVLPFKRRIPNE